MSLSLLAKLALVCGLIYVAIGAAMYFGQRRLMYVPDREHVDPVEGGLDGVSERRITAPDGQTVIAWYGPARPGQPTILYFHGNGGSLATRAERIRKYMARGRGIYMMTYRGYGGSTGTPTEANNVADAERAYDELRSLGVPAEQIFVYGESLGSGVAAQVAAVKPAAGLILDAPYTSIADVAQHGYPWLPARALVLDRYDTMAVIGKVMAPVLVVHGEMDDVIPVAMGRAVFAAAREPKFIATFPKARHDDHYMHGSYDVINAWIDKTFAGRKPASGSTDHLGG